MKLSKKKVKKGSTALSYKIRCMWFVNKLNFAESLFLKDCVIKHIQQLNDCRIKVK